MEHTIYCTKRDPATLATLEVWRTTMREKFGEGLDSKFPIMAWYYAQVKHDLEFPPPSEQGKKMVNQDGAQQTGFVF